MPILDRAHRIGENAASGDREQAPAILCDPRSHGQVEALVAVDQRSNHRELLPDDQLGRTGWRWRAQIRHEIGDGEVGLVSDGGHDGRPAGHDGASDTLVVEGPQILDRSTAAADDHDIEIGYLAQVAQGPNDLQRGTLPLDAYRCDHDAHVAEAPADDVQDVAQSSAAGRRDDAD